MAVHMPLENAVVFRAVLPPENGKGGPEAERAVRIGFVHDFAVSDMQELARCGQIEQGGRSLSAMPEISGDLLGLGGNMVIGARLRKYADGIGVQLAEERGFRDRDQGAALPASWYPRS